MQFLHIQVEVSISLEMRLVHSGSKIASTSSSGSSESPLPSTGGLRNFDTAEKEIHISGLLPSYSAPVCEVLVGQESSLHAADQTDVVTLTFFFVPNVFTSSRLVSHNSTLLQVLN